MSKWQKTRQPSVYVRHRAGCPANDKGRCRCEPSYYAQARHPQTKKVVKSPTFPTLDAATGWLVDFKRGRNAESTSSKLTLREMCEGFLEAAESGVIQPRGSSDCWSPITLDVYRRSLEKHIYPAQLGHVGTYGDALVDNLDVRDWQALLDRWHRAGFAYNSLVVMLSPVRSAYRWACSPTRRLVATNATTGLEMPAKKEEARERIATPEEVLPLLAALPLWLRVVFSLAFYAGMRRREIRVARWEWIDLEAGVIHVRISKTKKGIREVPIVGPLRAVLAEWQLAQGQRPGADVLLVPSPRGGMWELSTPLDRARSVWLKAKLEGIGLHECRHSYASFSIAAGVNAKSLQKAMGHASITETFDRYGHLMPGNEVETAGLQDAYLRKAVGE